jgi:hypothetical protein
VTDLQHRLEAGGRRRQPMSERPTALEVTAAQGMIARFSGFEQLAAAYVAATSANPDQAKAAAPGARLAAALAGWEVQAHRTLAARPDPADLVRVARVQALITSTTGILTEAAARKGYIDSDVLQRLAPSAGGRSDCLEPFGQTLGRTHQPSQPHRPSTCRRSQRAPRRDRDHRHQPNRMGYTRSARQPPRPPNIVKTLHLSVVASVDVAYVVRDTAADHPGLTAPARVIGMRSQGEAEIAIEQGETRFEGVTWTTPRQVATNQLIPLPEPARRGLINLADDVVAATNHAVAAAAQLDPVMSRDQTNPVMTRVAGVP